MREVRILFVLLESGLLVFSHFEDLYKYRYCHHKSNSSKKCKYTILAIGTILNKAQ